MTGMSSSALSCDCCVIISCTYIVFRAWLDICCAGSPDGCTYGSNVSVCPCDWNHNYVILTLDQSYTTRTLDYYWLACPIHRRILDVLFNMQHIIVVM